MTGRWGGEAISRFLQKLFYGPLFLMGRKTNDKMKNDRKTNDSKTNDRKTNDRKKITGRQMT